MTREELYIKIGRIERLVEELALCYKQNIIPSFSPNDDIFQCGNYAEEIYAYLRTNDDFKMLIDCCKINRHYLYRFRGSREGVGRSIGTIGYCLRKIHDLALSQIWAISKKDIDNCVYYVNSYEGVCRNSETGDLLPIPSTIKGLSQNGTQQKGVPIEFNTQEAIDLLQKVINNGFCDNNYKWTKSKSLLAYFADRASEYLGLGKGEYDGKLKTSWKPFEILFEMNGLSGAKKDYQRTGTLPDGYNTIDQLFK